MHSTRHQPEPLQQLLVEADAFMVDGGAFKASRHDAGPAEGQPGNTQTHMWCGSATSGAGSSLLDCCAQGNNTTALVQGADQNRLEEL